MSSMTTEHETEPNEQPEGWRRFVPPWWTLGFPVLATVGIAGWQAANAGQGQSTLGLFVSSVLWPGAAAFAIVLVIVWLGWTLEID